MYACHAEITHILKIVALNMQDVHATACLLVLQLPRDSELGLWFAIYEEWFHAHSICMVMAIITPQVKQLL